MKPEASINEEKKLIMKYDIEEIEGRNSLISLKSAIEERAEILNRWWRNDENVKKSGEEAWWRNTGLPAHAKKTET